MREEVDIEQTVVMGPAPERSEEELEALEKELEKRALEFIKWTAEHHVPIVIAAKPVDSARTMCMLAGGSYDLIALAGMITANAQSKIATRQSRTPSMEDFMRMMQTAEKEDADLGTSHDH